MRVSLFTCSLSIFNFIFGWDFVLDDRSAGYLMLGFGSCYARVGFPFSVGLFKARVADCFCLLRGLCPRV